MKKKKEEKPVDWAMIGGLTGALGGIAGGFVGGDIGTKIAGTAGALGNVVTAGGQGNSEQMIESAVQGVGVWDKNVANVIDQTHHSVDNIAQGNMQALANQAALLGANTGQQQLTGALTTIGGNVMQGNLQGAIGAATQLIPG